MQAVAWVERQACLIPRYAAVGGIELRLIRRANRVRRCNYLICIVEIDANVRFASRCLLRT